MTQISDEMIKFYQNEIIDNQKVSPVIDPEKEISIRVKFLKRYLKNSSQKSYVLGISGGQDSTLAGKLAQMAINELNEENNDVEYKFIAIMLPYGKQLDIEDSLLAIDFIGADKVFNHNIKPEVDTAVRSFNMVNQSPMTDFNKGNLKARVRMMTQYAYAGAYQGMVVGTDHSAENTTGFFTVWGDGASDIAPLFGLNKRQGRMLLKELNTPEKLYTKVPTADLLDDTPNMSDEEALGVTYEDLDDFLEGKEIPREIAIRIIERFKMTNFKRTPIPTIYNY